MHLFIVILVSLLINNTNRHPGQWNNGIIVVFSMIMKDLKFKKITSSNSLIGCSNR